MLTCRELDTNSQADIKVFEQAQYQAFSQSPIAHLEDIWQFDHPAQRVCSTFDYSKLTITVVEDQHTLLGAMVVHYPTTGPLQLNHFGFTLTCHTSRCAEGLSIFSLTPLVNGEVPLFVLRDFTNPILREKGFTTLFGTCSRARLKGYLLLGFRQVEKRCFLGEDKYLIAIEIP